MLPPLIEETGYLPLGRYNSTLNMVKEYYVDSDRFAGSSSREKIWNDFLTATEGLRTIASPISVWIGGSFLTSKLNPNDIDLVYFISESSVVRINENEDDLKLLNAYMGNTIGNEAGLSVDTFVCVWHFDPNSHMQSTERHWNYTAYRGYWDDLWSRARSGESTSPPRLEDAFSRRGYVEITLDGFDEV